MQQFSLHARLPNLTFGLSAVVLTLAMVLGGGTFPGLLGDLIAQLAAVPLLACAVWQLYRQPPTGMARLALWWLLLLLALFAFQMLPWPFALWSELPGRADIAAAYQLSGITAHFLAPSLNPYATEHALWTLLPAIALFLAMLTLNSVERRRLTLIVLGIAAAGAVLGLAQMAAGPDSALRFYSPTNPSEAVGFFANRNHFAGMLCMALPLAIAWLVGLIRERGVGGRAPILGVIALLLLGVLLIVGLMLSRSRAGIALGILGLFGGFLLAWSIGRGSRYVNRAVTLAAALGIALAIQFGLYGVLARLETDPLDDARWTFLTTTLKAADHFGAAGSGFGTFRNAYQLFETRDVMLSVYANHAHNDWAEIWLEGGWPVAALIALFLAWFAVNAQRVWRTPRSSPVSTAVARAATIAIVLALLHALVDYTLRTTAGMTVFALLCGLLVARRKPLAKIQASPRRVGRSEPSPTGPSRHLAPTPPPRRARPPLATGAT